MDRSGAFWRPARLHFTRTRPASGSTSARHSLRGRVQLPPPNRRDLTPCRILTRTRPAARDPPRKGRLPDARDANAPNSRHRVRGPFLAGGEARPPHLRLESPLCANSIHRTTRRVYRPDVHSFLSGPLRRSVTHTQRPPVSGGGGKPWRLAEALESVKGTAGLPSSQGQCGKGRTAWGRAGEGGRSRKMPVRVGWW